jgi:hypothetical protein
MFSSQESLHHYWERVKDRTRFLTDDDIAELLDKSVPD